MRTMKHKIFRPKANLYFEIVEQKHHPTADIVAKNTGPDVGSILDAHRPQSQPW
jgi:hypothetical protein